MAQSALTVTPPSPTPPSNFSCTGSTPPNPPNYTKTQYANPFNMSPLTTSGLGTSPVSYLEGRPQADPAYGGTGTGHWGVNQNPPPYFDDGTGATAIAFAANTGALASGTGATSGGTEGTYPGTDTAPFDTPNCVGAVPASTSVAHEGAGTEVTVTQTYAASVLVPGSAATYMPTGQTPAWAAGDPGGPLRTCSDLGNFTGVSNAAGTLNTSPNASHASSLSPATNPALTTATPGNTTAGAGNTTLAIVGTNFTKQSVVYYNGVAYPTVWNSATSLSVAAVPKKATAGTIPVYVITGGAVTTATVNATYV